MTSDLLFDGIRRRVEQDRQDGDIAYLSSLASMFEYVLKIVVAGIIASLDDHPERYRYSLEHKLVRADSLGDWIFALDAALTGRASEAVTRDARLVTKDLTERVDSRDWRYSSVSNIHSALSAIGASPPRIGARVALRESFTLGVQLRNRLAHGAVTTTQCNAACPAIRESVTTIVDRMELFRLPWVHLHRNLSGKYRVSGLLNDASPFDFLKSSHNEALPDGVYYGLGRTREAVRPVHVPMIFREPSGRDFVLPNGNHRNNRFESLSYVTNEVYGQDGTNWSRPPDRLPPSETEGSRALDVQGHVLGNVPELPYGYVRRADLEDQLHAELSKTYQHEIVSLTGPGGIGKTSIAIAALEAMRSESGPFDHHLWISARDIDLLDSGPKPVSQKVADQDDISRAAAALLEPVDRNSEGFNAKDFFEEVLGTKREGVVLVILDNFETVRQPADVFNWIDAHVRTPNKVLITTRTRDFVGDYGIRVSGMEESEAQQLIVQHAKRLDIEDDLTQEYKDELVRESDGHPYVIKILLGEHTKTGQFGKPERIVANADQILEALFRRTFGALTPAAQRVFLLLCSWRVVVPRVAVEAVVLRPGTQRIDVSDALEQLERYSLVETIESEKDQSLFLAVPLAATQFGQRELKGSRYEVSVHKDRELLMDFRPGKRTDVEHGVFPRIKNFVQAVAERAGNDSEAWSKNVAVLECLARACPLTYPLLARLVYEIRGSDGLETAQRYMRNYLQDGHVPLPERRAAWQKLATLYRESGYFLEELKALSEAALLSSEDHDALSEIANKLNICISHARRFSPGDWEMSGEETVQSVLPKMITAIEGSLGHLSATDCSRLAWLHVHLRESARAYEIARLGIQRDPDNQHCRNLVTKLAPEAGTG